MISKSAIKMLEIHSFASSACRIYPCKGATWAVTFVPGQLPSIEITIMLNRVQFETRSTNLPRSPRGGEDLNWNLRVSNWTRFSRIRAYTFAKACRERGLNAEVLSFFDHLGAPGQGSAAYRMDEQSK